MLGFQLEQQQPQTLARFVDIALPQIVLVLSGLQEFSRHPD
jgi:hypothetical protein